MPKQNARSPSLTSQESYSAVIIADLVAEVQVPEEKGPQATIPKSTKEETNLGYDGHLDGESGPATVNPDTKQINLSSMKANGAGISKGVILNAVQFGQSEPNGKGDDKVIQLTNALSIQTLTQPPPEPSGFKDMSILRKIAFGFSFLPSIMFVLCFAIILPCNVPKPCVETIWIRTLNNTVPTSSLETAQNVVFTVLEENINYFVALYTNDGSVNYKEKIPAKATYLHCGNFMNKIEKNCFIMDEAGNITVFNSTKGVFLWDPVSGEKHPQPITLPHCSGEVESIAVAVNNTHLKILSDGNVVSRFVFTGCDSVPSRLLPWTRNGSSDIIIICKNDGQDMIQKVPQNAWCRSDIGSSGDIWTLHPKIASRDYILQPIEDGLVLWSGEEVSMLLPDGSEEWKITSDLHSDSNRFILHGNFIGKHKQVALLSSDISTKIQITILNSTDGSMMKSHSINASEATDVIQIQGKERDFVLLVLKTIRKDVVTETLEHITTISTTVINYISNENITDTPLLFAKNTAQELAFLDLDGTIYSIKNLEDADSKVSMTVVQERDFLSIYLLRFLEDSSFPTQTEVRHIKVANWDISTSKSLECTLK